MEIDQAAEYRRLTEHYRTLYDDELLNLAADQQDLTDLARLVLRDEIKLRGLEDRSQSKSGPDIPVAIDGSAAINIERPFRHRSPDPNFEIPEDGQPYDVTWKVPLCECRSSDEAWMLGNALSRAGIESWVEYYSGFRDRPVQIAVAADQLEEARAIAAQPIPQDIIDELSSVAEIPPYVSPTCPGCGAADPILESTESANLWTCDVCGREWTDSAEPAAPETA